MKITFPAWERLLIWISLKRHNDCGDGRHDLVYPKTSAAWLKCTRCPFTFGYEEKP